MRLAISALLLLVAPAFADQPPRKTPDVMDTVLLDLAHAADRNNGLWVILHYYGVERPIEQDVYQSGNQYFAYLPELKANELVEFCISFENLEFAKSGVVALLTLDDSQKAAVWNGSKFRK